MRILHLVVGGTRGGTESVVRDILHKSNHENVYCCLLQSGPVFESLRDEGYECIDLSGCGFVARINRVNNLIQGVDAVCLHSFFGKAALIGNAIQLNGKPLILFLHCCFDKSSLKASLRLPGWVYLTKRLYGRVDLAIAISDFVLENHQKCFRQFANACVLHNAVNVEKFVACADLSRPISDPIKILYLGRLWKIKGVQTLIGACRQLALSGTPFQLTIAGWGPYRSELEALSKKYHVNASFVGEVSNPEECYAAHDLFVSSVICDEGFGLTIVEAMAAGCLCIASNAGGIPEIFDCCRAGGYLVEKGDEAELARAIERVLAMGPSEVLRARQGVYECACNFSLDKYADEYDRLIESTIK